MKKLAAFLLVSCGLLTASPASEAFVKITWSYHSGQPRSWEQVNYNKWGGQNSWCIGQDGGCDRWDWRTVYFSICSAQSLTSDQTATTYPDAPMAEAAIEMNITLPSLGTPTVNIEEYPY